MIRKGGSLVRRLVRFVVRLAATLVVFAVVVGVPVALVVLVGRPVPSLDQLRAAWRSGRIDDDSVIRLGTALFLLLWAWFAASAVGEVHRALRWRAGDRARPLPAAGGGPTGWLRQLVRVAVLSSVATAGVVAAWQPSRSPVVAATHGGRAVPAEVVDTPLGAAHVVVRGDSYWRIADGHLEDEWGREPSGREVYDYVHELIDENAPRLGHRDPTLIHPGELVVLTAVPADPQVPPPRVPIPRVEPDVTVQPREAAEAAAPPASVPPTVTPPVVAPPVTAPPVTAAPVTAPPAPVVRQVVDGRSALAPVLMGLGGAVLAGAGTLRWVDAARRRRMRAAQVGLRLATPSATVVATEMELRRPALDERLARLDLAVRALAHEVAPQGARVMAAVLGWDGAVRVHVDGPAAPTAAMWRLHLDSSSWVVPADVGTEMLAASAGAMPAPCPALVHLGASDDGDVFVDLEAVGRLGVEAPGGMGDEIVRAVAASLAVSPFADGVHVVGVGVGHDDVPVAERLDVVETLDAALDAAAEAVGSTSSTVGGSSTFVLRAAGHGETWDPAVIVARGEAGRDPSVESVIASMVGAGGRGIGVVASPPLAGSPWLLRVTAERCVLEPLGIELTPVGMSTDDVARMAALIATADEPLVPAAPAIELTGSVEPAWSLMVHLLGHVEVVSADGETVTFDRGKSLELVVWLSQHRRYPTRAGARTALWGTDVRDATFANVVSDARRALARSVAPPEGEEWIGRTLTESLPLHDGVITDAELLERRVAAARGLPPAEAVEMLRPGLELVTGMPFAGTSFLWPDAEGITSALTLLATSAAIELAEHYLALGDAEGVFWATGQGLQVLSAHEELISLRMRAHAAAGDLAGVRQEWEAYERALVADPWADAEPAPKLVALRRELLSPPLAS